MLFFGVVGWLLACLVAVLVPFLVLVLAVAAAGVGVVLFVFFLVCFLCRFTIFFIQQPLAGLAQTPLPPEVVAALKIATRGDDRKKADPR